MELNAIHHVAIIVSDYAKARDFYVDKLGFAVVRENYRPARGDWKLDLRLGDCELACKFGAISIVNDLARVDAHKCVACGACEKACPRSVIKLLPAESTVTVRCQNSETGRIAREMCMKACIGCKLCERQCEYDAIHVQNGFARIDPDKCTRCGKCAEKCPAGCITLE